MNNENKYIEKENEFFQVPLSWRLFAIKRIQIN